MRKKNLVTEILLGQKLLPLYYHESAEVSVDILKALYNGGIRVVEYTNRGENALKNFAALKIQTHAYIQGFNLVSQEFDQQDVFCKDQKGNIECS